jgi:hypothetical protein
VLPQDEAVEPTWWFGGGTYAVGENGLEQLAGAGAVELASVAG